LAKITDLELVTRSECGSQCTGGVDVAKPETKEMPSGRMTSPPKGKKKAAAEMPSGEMNEPAAESPAKKKSGKKK
jgi:hypothetical protein